MLPVGLAGGRPLTSLQRPLGGLKCSLGGLKVGASDHGGEDRRLHLFSRCDAIELQLSKEHYHSAGKRSELTMRLAGMRASLA